MTTIKLQFDERTLERVRQLAVLRHSTIEILVKEMIELLSVIEVPDDSLLGMFAQEPELINQVVESAMKAREATPLRLPRGQEMNRESRYVKLVEWSEEDGCFIGSCPELFYGGCHGDNEHEVFDELCQIVEETIELYRQDNKTLPPPLSGKEFVNALQKTA